MRPNKCCITLKIRWRKLLESVPAVNFSYNFSCNKMWPMIRKLSWNCFRFASLEQYQRVPEHLDPWIVFSGYLFVPFSVEETRDIFCRQNKLGNDHGITSCYACGLGHFVWGWNWGWLARGEVDWDSCCGRTQSHRVSFLPALSEYILSYKYLINGIYK